MMYEAWWRWLGLQKVDFFRVKVCAISVGSVPDLYFALSPVQNWQAKFCQENSIFFSGGCPNRSSFNFFDGWELALRVMITDHASNFDHKHIKSNCIEYLMIKSWPRYQIRPYFKATYHHLRCTDKRTNIKLMTNDSLKHYIKSNVLAVIISR